MKLNSIFKALVWPMVSGSVIRLIEKELDDIQETDILKYKTRLKKLDHDRRIPGAIRKILFAEGGLVDQIPWDQTVASAKNHILDALSHL